jgi:hypothetical protein
MAYLDEELSPDADLLESMRAVGYSLKTAIADLCDNSIAADCQNIWLSWGVPSKNEGYVTLVDDGKGMTRDELRTAMKLAGKPPSAERLSKDLGRFGLGLKTASLSQCRTLTVISKKNNILSAARWDLDHVLTSKAWNLQWLDQESMNLIPGLEDLESLESGTLVCWQNLDLMLGNTGNKIETQTTEMAFVVPHLSLVFHRFIETTPSERVNFYANSNKLKAIDPFLTGPKGSLAKGESYITIGGQTVTVKPYILPPISKMTSAQKANALFAGNMKDAQGFYIYRNKRLLTFGTWFRLTPRSEVAKLARVQVDTTNELDSEWRLGIMKSSVIPPQALRKALTAIVPKIVGESETVSVGRGRRITASGTGPWEFRELGEGAFSIEINRAHPLMVTLIESLTGDQIKRLDGVFSMLETQFPADYFHSRLSVDNKFVANEDEAEHHRNFASELFLSLRPTCGSSAETWQQVLSIEPFATNATARAQIEDLISTTD